MRRLKNKSLQEMHGDLETQHNNLVDKICSAFQDPEKWPATDQERIDLLRDIYRAAMVIKETVSSIP